jgi:hypothetical protein
MRGAALALLLPGWAAAQLQAPRIGCLVDPAGRLREVLGVAGTLIVSEPRAEGVLAVMCGPQLTVLKTASELEVNGVRYAAPEGPAILSPDGLVYYPVTGEWLRATPESLEAVEPAAPGEAVALGGRAVIYRSDGRLWLRKDGRDTEIAGQGPAPALTDGGDLVRAEGSTLRVGDRELELPAAPAQVSRLGPGWLRIVLTGEAGEYGLALEGLRLFRLPEAAP